MDSTSVTSNKVTTVAVPREIRNAGGMLPREPAATLSAFENQWNNLSLPPSFHTLLRHRFNLDQLQAVFYAMEEELISQPLALPERTDSRPDAIDIVRFNIPAPVRAYRLALPERVIPLRGYRAPILDRADQQQPVTSAEANWTETQAKAATLVEEQLASHGLLATLAPVVATLGPASMAANHPQALADLNRVGFPVDLLAFFRDPSLDSRDPHQALWRVAEKLAAGESVSAVQTFLSGLTFRFRKSHPDFQIATESGDHEIGLLRLQAGGGYRDGIIPGGSIDIIAQLVRELPESDFIVSVPEPFLRDLNRLARLHWTLTRSNQLTMVGEPLGVSAWTQDNGKAGVLASTNGQPYSVATLAPRYSSLNEGDSQWAPGESFLMDGVNAASHPVIHSPLLFQGGNLLPVHDPARQERVLLIGEAGLYRNMALGLTRDQVLEAFRVEFAVDRCVVLPAVSFHLDFDVSIRRHGKKLIAFVNDTRAAVRLILERGIAALETHEVLDAATVAQARQAWRDGDDAALHALLAAAIYSRVNEAGQYPTDMQRWFAVEPSDAPAFNFKGFLTALDLLASRILTSDQLAGHPLYERYLGTLRDLEASAADQHAVLRELGWEIVPVPGLPDLGCGMHYLNGIHDAARYLMPALGGYYEAFDDAAAQAFAEALGDKVEIIPIMTAEAQFRFGAVHCAAAAYPKIEPSKIPKPRKGS